MPQKKQLRKQVMVPDGFVPRLEEMFGVSRVTISQALNFRTDSEKARRIRHQAVQMGGSLFDPAQHGYEHRNRCL